MKPYVLGLLLFAGAGCNQMFVPGADLEAKMRASSAAPPVAITADQVTTLNAHPMSQALWEELDRDTHRDLLNRGEAIAQK